MSIIPDISGVRGSLYCYRCGGGFWTRGQNKLVPHAPDCPRSPHRRPQSTRQQDEERRALTTGFDDLDSPWSTAKPKRQTFFPARAPWEQDVTIAGGF